MEGVGVDDVYLGNGVSELIAMALQALLNNDDEVLIPAPDYPLWTAVTSLCRGRAVHYRCDEAAGWLPDLDDVAARITPRTRALVVINPNNPTGAVYPRALLEGLVELARRHELVLFSDEIYDRILYDGARHTATATLAPDVLCLTFSGLSKAYRVAGFRSGLAGRVRPDSGTPAAIWRGSTSSPTCACARTCRVSTRSSRRSAAPTPSPTWCCRAGACWHSATAPGSS